MFKFSHESRFPWLALFLVAILVTLSLIIAQHDKRVWRELSATFSQHLMPDELDRYLSYVKRESSLNPDTLLSKKYSESKGLKQSLAQTSSQDDTNSQNDTNSQDDISSQDANLNVTRLILDDLKFTQYMFEEGNLFVDPWTYAAWKEARQELALQSESLLQNRLSLSSGAPEFKAVLTHLFITPSLSKNQDVVYNLAMFIALVLGLLIALAVCEVSMPRARLLGFILVYLSIDSFLYLQSASVLSPAHSGFYGLLLFLFILSLYLRLPHLQRWGGIEVEQESKLNEPSNRLTLYKVYLPIVAYVLVVSSVLIAGFVYYGERFLDLIVALVASIATVTLVYLNQRILDSQKPLSIGSAVSQQDWEYRAELAKAFDFLSRFEFSAAKQVLNKLAKQYPHSNDILEHRYHLSKLQPSDLNHAKLTQQLIELSLKQNDYDRMQTVFKDIQKSTLNKHRAAKFLTPSSYHKMMMMFINHNDLNAAERAFHFLELEGDIAIKQEACKLLIDKFRVAEMTQKQQQYEMLLQRF